MKREIYNIIAIFSVLIFITSGSRLKAQSLNDSFAIRLNLSKADSLSKFDLRASLDLYMALIESIERSILNNTYLGKAFEGCGRMYYNLANYGDSYIALDSSCYFTEKAIGRTKEFWERKYLTSRAAIYSDNTEVSINIAEQCVAYFSSINDNKNLALSQLVLAEGNIKNQNFSKVEGYLNKVEDYIIKNKGEEDLIYRYHDIRLNYFLTEELFTKALQESDSMVKLSQNLTPRKKYQSISNRSIILFKLSQFDSAKKEIHKAIEVGHSINIHENDIVSLPLIHHLALIYSTEKDYWRADSILNYVMSLILNDDVFLNKKEYKVGLINLCCTYIENAIYWKNNSKVNLGFRILDSLRINENDIPELTRNNLRIVRLLNCALSQCSEFEKWINEFYAIRNNELKSALSNLSEVELINYKSTEKVNDINFFFQVYDEDLYPQQLKLWLWQMALNVKNIELSNRRNLNEFLKVVKNQNNEDFKIQRNKYYSKELDLVNDPQNRALRNLQIEEKKILRSVEFQNFKKTKEIEFEKLRSLLKDDEVIIDYFRHVGKFNPRDSSFEKNPFYIAIAVHKSMEVPVFISLADEELLNELISTEVYSWAGQNELTLNRGTSYGLRKRLRKDNSVFLQVIKPVLDKFPGVNSLLVSSTGVLNKLNFNAIQIDGSQYMLDKFKTIQFSTIDRIYDFLLKKRVDVKSVVLMGGLEFGEHSLNDSKATQWNDLFGTLKEIESIEKYFNWNSDFIVRNIRGKNAIEDLVKIEFAKSPDLIHIATHAYFNSAQTDEEDVYSKSALVLSHANQLGGYQKYSPTDGYLTARDLLLIDLSKTQFVVLSACESGLGEFMNNNEGFYGIQRALQIAGVKKVLSSLWSVPDEATKELMVAFYFNWIRLGQEPNEALHNAQLKVKQTNDDPYNWAGFVLIN